MARDRAGITQRKLALKAGCPLSTITGIEAGGRMPQIDTIEVLARALGVSSGWLAYGDDDAGTGVELLRQIVPKERVFTRPGDHDWDVWAPLWRTMLPVIPWTGAALQTAAPAEASAEE